MPRVSRAEAESHREQITEASSRLFRERGIKGVSVADLMGAAGLTHGGFYGHFESKDALAAVAPPGPASEAWSPDRGWGVVLSSLSAARVARRTGRSWS